MSTPPFGPPPGSAAGPPASPPAAPAGTSPTQAGERLLTIAELNRLARQALESRFPLCWVTGEISNLTVAASGHAYFTLKDAQAQVRCVMFRSRAQTVGFRLANGTRVDARVLVTLYEARGDFQLNVESLRRAGTGNLYEEFLRLKARLEQEGLFAAERKRPLPVFPRTIGIVTSPQAAALRDVLTTLRRRSPHIRVVLYPTPVQGEPAAAQIAAALETAARRAECDVVLLCRGGGSLEDLWSFNDERVARAIRACSIPVVCGVGHETDFTIADFAADLRAPTPTAAAELAAPSREDLLRQLRAAGERLDRAVRRDVERRAQHVDLLARRLRHPAERLAAARQGLLAHAARLQRAGRRALEHGHQQLALLTQRWQHDRPPVAAFEARLQSLNERLRRRIADDRQARHWRVEHLAAQLRHLDPRAVLDRGYSIVQLPDGRILRNAADAELNGKIHVNLAKGRLEARVDRLEISHNDEPGVD